MKPVEIVDAGVQRLLPRRLVNRGPPQTIKTEARYDKKERWWSPVSPEKLEDNQKKLVMGCVVQSMITTVFSNHFYEWDGQVFRQQDGGPIGLRATQPVSRIIMDFWAKEMRKIQELTVSPNSINPIQYEELDIKNLLKYVDD